MSQSAREFTDAGLLDTHSAEIDWGDGAVEPATVSQAAGAGTAGGEHVYLEPGVYTVTVTVLDDDGGIGLSRFESVVIVDATPDLVPPNGTVESPLPNSTSVGSVELSGTATDDVAVAEVRVALRDRDTGLWYRSDGTWGAFQYQLAQLDDAESPSTRWTLTWSPPSTGSGSYAFGLTAVDTSGNVDPTKPWTLFNVTPDGEPDLVPPNGTVESPLPNSTSVGSVELSGTATDDVAVAEVRVALRDRDTGLWYRSDGTWGAFQYQLAQLDDAESPSTRWTLTWSPPSTGSGSYAFLLTAVDTSGNVDPTKPWTLFNVTPDGEPDLVPPNGTVESPLPNSTSVGSVELSGTATDDVAVAEVRVALRDRDTGLWYRSDGTWGAFQYQLAQLDDAESPSTRWTLTWSPPSTGSGSYAFLLTAVDTSGNVDPTKPWTLFNVTAG